MPPDFCDVVFSPLAAAQHLLSRPARISGALLFDIGGGTTDYVMYQDDQLVASGCCGMGGDHITNDLGMLFNIPWPHAELLKKTHGNANGQRGRSIEYVKLKPMDGSGEIVVPRDKLDIAVHDRIYEILMQVKNSLPEDTFSRKLCKKVFLCGGTSLMRGIGDLTAKTFGVPVALKSDRGENDIPSYIDDPRYSTTIGLIRYAQIMDAEAAGKGSLLSKIKSWFGKSK